jgi:homoserine dehydrogenase
MSDPLRLGIAGLGTVGVGVIRIIRKQAALLEARTGRRITISAVSARSKDKDRGVSLSDYAWEDDPVALATRDDVDLFVELMGGEDGPAKNATEAALKAGKDVVTANKAMLAIHGQSLAELAEAANRAIRYEAAVAGGIPVIKALMEGLAGNQITRVMGVMNGSCNYILTRMENSGKTYQEIFAEADGLGYLEADPQLDVGGIDAAHKLAILSAIAFGTRVNFDGIQLEGIERVSIEDIRAAADMGYKIKLLGVAQMTGRGLEQRMQPCLCGDGRCLRHCARPARPGLWPARSQPCHLNRSPVATACALLPADGSGRQTRCLGQDRNRSGRGRRQHQPDAPI